ncbi:hypothetical protein PGB90_007892 [Kerria lacca]
MIYNDGSYQKLQKGQKVVQNLLDGKCHIERSTTWDDPRKTNVASSQQQQCRNSITAAISAASPVTDLHSHTQQGNVPHNITT